MAAIISDTSTWIDYLQGQPNELLRDALDNGTVILPPLVVAEMVAGAMTTDAHIVQMRHGARAALLLKRDAVFAKIRAAHRPPPHFCSILNGSHAR